MRHLCHIRQWLSDVCWWLHEGEATDAGQSGFGRDGDGGVDACRMVKNWRVWRTSVAPGPQQALALRPMGRGAKRLVVVLADTAGTETTDFLVPYGILTRSGAVEVRAVGSDGRPVPLMPALELARLEPVRAFERANPMGADVVVVPAMHRDDTPAIRAFVQRQAALGAAFLSICEGAFVVAGAGLLQGRPATTHWYALRRIARRYPDTSWVRDARFVVDGPVMSTTGVSASVPATLALLERLAGRDAAGRAAVCLGVPDWSPAHSTAAFGHRAELAVKVAANAGAFWRHEKLAIAVPEGFDEVGLALQADAWARTCRSSVVAVNPAGLVRSATGLVLRAEPQVAGRSLLPLMTGPAGTVLDATLAAIAARYGAATARLLALQLEYRRSAD